MYLVTVRWNQKNVKEEPRSETYVCDSPDTLATLVKKYASEDTMVIVGYVKSFSK